MAVPIPQGEDSAALADWVETSIVNGGHGAISFSRIARLLKGEASELAEQELSEEAGEVEEELAADELEVDLGRFGQEAESLRDQRIEFLEAEIERRARLAPRLYPFRIEAERVKKVSVCGEQAYLALLALSSPHASCPGVRIVIDRLRLLELLSELECEELEALVSTETREWVARELATI